MSRDHVEFIQSQQLPWEPTPWRCFAGTDCKILSRDEHNGAATALVRFGTGWYNVEYGYLEAAEEILVLEGELRVNERVFHQDCYTYLPAGTVHTHVSCDHGALIIVFFDREPGWRPGVPAAHYDSTDCVPYLDAFEMTWEQRGMDPVYGNAGSRWKLLRGGPDQPFMTNLITSPPHRHPPAWRGPQERHDCVEEMFLISGEYLSNVGIMRPGAYFWRPPGVLHGPYGTRSPTLALIRTLGAPLRNNWTEREVQISRDPPLTPHLPSHGRTASPGSWHPAGF